MANSHWLSHLTQKRLLWRSVLAAIFLVPLLLVVPHLRSLVVRNAVVTAYVSVLRAPIDGDVVEVSALPGQSVNGMKSALQIKNPRADRSRVERLRAVRDEAKRQMDAHLEAVQMLQKLAAARQTELGRYVETLLDELGTKKMVLQGRVAALESSVTETQNALARARQLHSRKNMSRAGLEAAEAKFHDARAERSENALELQRIDKQIQDLGQGIFQTDVPDGALQTQRMAQELAIEVARQQGVLNQMKANLFAVEAELVAAERALFLQGEADMRVPTGMTIWRTDVTPGTSVVAGTKLLTFVDCSRLMVDIAVDDATLELIEPGQPVRVRLFGRPGFVDGEVRLVRGSAGLAGSDDLAATVRDRGPRAGRVLASLDDPDLAKDPARTCGIGRAAYAEFQGIGFFESVFLPLIR